MVSGAASAPELVIDYFIPHIQAWELDQNSLVESNPCCTPLELEYEDQHLDHDDWLI